MPGDTRRHLNLVAVLMGVDAEVLAQLIAVVFDAKFDLFRVTCSDPDAAIIGFHAHIGAPRHGKRLGYVFSTRSDRGNGQQGRESDSEPHTGRAVGQQLPTPYTPSHSRLP